MNSFPHCNTKTKSRFLFTVACLCSLLVSCSTVYDQNGKPHTVVTPQGAIVGAVATGLIGYNLSKNRYKDRDYVAHHPGASSSHCHRTRGYRPHHKSTCSERSNRYYNRRSYSRPYVGPYYGQGARAYHGYGY